jgi:D-galactarolactone cycloisomerase
MVRGVSRRAWVAGAVGLLTAAPAFSDSRRTVRRPDGLLAFADSRPAVDLTTVHDRPIVVRSLELWRMPGEDPAHLVRVVSEDGVEGVVRASTKAAETVEFFRLFALENFVGADVRGLNWILERTWRHGYEYGGVPFWSAVGQAEVAIWDLIGRTVGRPCHALMGGKLRSDIPLYLSSSKRTTPPEEEIAHLQARVAETGCRAIKLKIGKRMGRNADQWEGRSEAMIALARRTFGDDMTIYADANGAYDAPTALEVCRMLQAHGVALLEEPCPPEEIEMAGQVTANTDLRIAGGENESALERWRGFCEDRTFDVLQPDPMYNGGMLRCLNVMRMSVEAGLDFNPHFPRSGADVAPLLHLCAVAPNLWGYQEYRSRPDAQDYVHSPVMAPVNGVMTVPDRPGWGIDYDPSVWRTATRIVPA